MNGIDIASYQSGLDLAKISFDFCIVKATEGFSYVNPSFEKHVKQSLGLGKCTGVYHYVNGHDAQKEAAHFAAKIKPYLGKVLVCIDWEDGGNSAWGDLDYLRRFVNALRKLTGDTPTFALYCSASAFPWALAKELGMLAWVAQYASNNVVEGYQSQPWNEGKYTCAIRQYSGNGRVSGYSGALDLDKAYITAAQWASYCGGAVAPSKPAAEFTIKGGRYKVVTPSGVKIRRKASTSEGDTGKALGKGDAVYLDAKTIKADGYYWGTYTGYSGKRCYVAVRRISDGKDFMVKA